MASEQNGRRGFLSRGRLRMIDSLAPGLIAAAVLLFFRRVVFGGAVFFFRDFGLFFYPRRLLAAQAVRSGTLPFWESFSGGGQPVLGAYQSAVLYPLSVVYYLLPLPRSLMVFVVLHFFITGAGAYYMLRAWKVRPAPATAGALIWTFSPPLVAIVDNVSFLTALAWLPWCMFFASRLLRRGNFASFAGLAATFAMALLAGAPEPVIFIALFVLLLVSLHLWATRKRRTRGAARRCGMVFAALLVALLLAGAALVPLAEHLPASRRPARLAESEAGASSLPPRDSAHLLLPRFGLTPGRGGIHWGGQTWLKTIYCGVPTLFLALFALALAGRRGKAFFALFATGFALLALGSNFPLWRFLYRTLPAFGLIRYPVKFFLPSAFALSVLASFSLNDIARRARLKSAPASICSVSMLAAGLLMAALFFAGAVGAKLPWAVLFKALAGSPSNDAGGAAAAMRPFIATLWSLGRSALILVSAGALAIASVLARDRGIRAVAFAAFSAVLVCDVALFSGDLNPLAGREIYETPPAGIATIDRSPGAGRILMTDELRVFTEHMRIGRFAGARGLVTYLMGLKGPAFMKPEESLKWAGRAAGGDFTDLIEFDRYLTETPAADIAEPAQYEFFKEVLYPDTQILYRIPAARGHEVLAVGWSWRLFEMLRETGNTEAIKKLFAVSLVFERHDWVPNFRQTPVLEAAPRAALVREVAAVAGDEEALAAVSDEAFDPARSVVLIGADAESAREFIRGGAETAEQGGGVKWLADTGNRQVLQVETSAPALLYVADNYHPAFTAHVDGKQAPLYRANYAFRAVPVAAGRHEVEFAYDLAGLHRGLAASATGGLILLACGIFWKRVTRHRRFRTSVRAKPSLSRAD